MGRLVLAGVIENRTIVLEPMWAGMGWLCARMELGRTQWSRRRWEPPIVEDRLWFPDASLAGDDGLVATGGDLSVPRLVLAYRSGLFPWTERPVTWWSPNPRTIIELEGLHVSRSLKKFLAREPFTITVDRAFPEVIAACATEHGPVRRGWLTPGFTAAYTALHRAGHAHSVECWEEGKLVGGIYGVTVGGLFAGESMFHRASNASKVALVKLVAHLRARGCRLFDIQMTTPVTRQMGAVEIPRAEYLRRLKVAMEVADGWFDSVGDGR